MIKILMGLLSMALVLGCCCPGAVSSGSSSSNGSSAQRSRPANSQSVVLDLTKLYHASPQAVEAVFGKATVITPIDSTPDQMPGEFRDYETGAAKKYVLTRFYRGRLVMIQMELPRKYDSAVECLAAYGIDTSQVSPRAVAPAATRWTAKFGDLIYKDVAALSSAADTSTGFDMVQLEWPTD